MTLSPQAIYCLNEAIIKLHDAARLVEDNKTAGMITELADCAEAIKKWGNDEHK